MVLDLVSVVCVQLLQAAEAERMKGLSASWSCVLIACLPAPAALGAVQEAHLSLPFLAMQTRESANLAGVVPSSSSSDSDSLRESLDSLQPEGSKIEGLLEVSAPSSSPTIQKARRNFPAFEAASFLLLLLPLVGLLAQKIAAFTKETRTLEAGLTDLRTSGGSGLETLHSRHRLSQILSLIVCSIAAFLVSNFVYRGARLAFPKPWLRAFMARRQKGGPQLTPKEETPPAAAGGAAGGEAEGEVIAAETPQA